jgi:SPX domain protein involved in polyphosphate accumulation
MVNFSEKLESQHISEWRDAYCDYKQLKKDLEHVKENQLDGSSRDQHPQSHGHHSLEHIRMPPFQQLRTLTRTLTRRISNTLTNINTAVKVCIILPIHA